MEAAAAAALRSPTAAAAGPSRRPAATGASSLHFDRRRSFASGSIKVGMSFWFLCYGESSVSCRVWASIIRMMKEELDLISDFSVLGWLPCPFLFFFVSLFTVEGFNFHPACFWCDYPAACSFYNLTTFGLSCVIRLSMEMEEW
jgi:hypothetical protein